MAIRGIYNADGTTTYTVTDQRNIHSKSFGGKIIYGDTALVVSAQSTPNMTVKVSSGECSINGAILQNTASTNLTITSNTASYARIFYEESVEGQEEPIKTILISHAEDVNSINCYRRREKVSSASSDIKLQETLDAQVKEELETYKNPLVSCNVKIGISDVFNIFDIEPGDYVTLNSEEKRINQKIRVLEYTVNLTENTVSISLGNSIFRDAKPQIYRFR